MKNKTKLIIALSVLAVFNSAQADTTITFDQDLVTAMDNTQPDKFKSTITGFSLLYVRSDQSAGNTGCVSFANLRSQGIRIQSNIDIIGISGTSCPSSSPTWMIDPAKNGGWIYGTNTFPELNQSNVVLYPKKSS